MPIASASINLQHKDWSGVSHHVNRTYLDAKHGSGHDVNKNIDPEFSDLNLSSDYQIKVSHNQSSSSNAKIKYRVQPSLGITTIHRKFIHLVNERYRPYIQIHNQSKSVKKNPDRKINTDAYHYFFKDKDRNRAHSQFFRATRTFSDNYENADSNLKNIHLIMEKKHLSFSKARHQYLQTMSHALAKKVKDFNNHHKYLKVLHWGTNVDETAGTKQINGKTYRVPDGLHVQGELVSLGWTKFSKDGTPIIKKHPKYTSTGKLQHTKSGRVKYTRAGKPSFNFGRALCADEYINYSRKRSHGHNQSVSQALKKFHQVEGQRTVSFCSHFLYQRFHLPEFRNQIYQPKHSKVTGLNQQEYIARRKLMKHKKALDQNYQKKVHQNRSKSQRNRRYRHRLAEKKYRLKKANSHLKQLAHQNALGLNQERSLLSNTRQTHSSLVAQNIHLRASNYSIQQSQSQAKSKAQSIINGARSEVEKFHTSTYGSLVASVTSVSLSNSQSLKASYLSASKSNQATLHNKFTSGSNFLDNQYKTLSSIFQRQGKAESASLSNRKNSLVDSLNNNVASKSTSQSQSLSVYGSSIQSSYNDRASSQANQRYSEDYSGMVISFNTSVSSASSSVALGSSSNAQAFSSMNETIQSNNAYVGSFMARRKKIRKEQDQRKKQQDQREHKLNQKSKNLRAEFDSLKTKFVNGISSMISSGVSKVSSVASVAPQKIGKVSKDIEDTLHSPGKRFGKDSNHNTFNKKSIDKKTQPDDVNYLKKYNQEQASKDQNQREKEQEQIKKNGRGFGDD